MKSDVGTISVQDYLLHKANEKVTFPCFRLGRNVFCDRRIPPGCAEFQITERIEWPVRFARFLPVVRGNGAHIYQQ